SVYLLSLEHEGDGSISGTLEGRIGNNYSGEKDFNIAGFLNQADRFGYDVSLNADGYLLAIGASQTRGANDEQAYGAVYLFSFDGPNLADASLVGIIGKGYADRSNDIDVERLDSGDSFGGAVALNAAGDRLIVGVNQDDGLASFVASNVGAVYMFRFDNGT